MHEPSKDSRVQRLIEREPLWLVRLEASPIAILLHTADGLLLVANASAVRLLGYDGAEELVGRHVAEIIAEEDREQTLQRFVHQVVGAHVDDSRRCRVLRRDGTVITVDLSSSVFDDEGEPVALTTYIQDVTERVRVEEALRHSEQLYRTLAELSPDSIIQIDAAGTIVMANPQAARLCGFERVDEILGTTIFDYTPTEEWARAREDLRRSVATGLVEYVTFDVLTHDGRHIPTETNAALVPDTGGDDGRVSPQA